jgi:hypothetical protein
MEFGEVLSRAWQIVWRHKVLWIFGLLASCGSGSRGSSVNYNVGGDGTPTPAWAQGIERWLSSVPEWQLWLVGAAVVLGILLLIALTIVLSTIGRVGLIRGTQQADRGAARLTFGELWSASLPYFWRIFGLNLLFALAIVVIVVILTILFVVLGVATAGILLLCLIPLACILVPLFWFATLVVEQANVAIVVDDLGIQAGAERAWELVRANVGPILLMGLILTIGIEWIAGTIIALPLVAVAAPLIPAVIFGGERALAAGLVLAGLCFLAYLPILLILGGILHAYMQSAWTLTYLRLQGRRAPAEVVEPSPAAL